MRAEWTPSGACTSGSTALPRDAMRRASGGAATTSTTSGERKEFNHETAYRLRVIIAHIDLTQTTCLTKRSSLLSKESLMQRTIGLLVLALMLTSLSGCSYLFYPRAGDYARQAKGASGVETMINLTNMMEATAGKAKGGKGVDTAFDDLHNQFHALNDA